MSTEAASLPSCPAYSKSFALTDESSGLGVGIFGKSCAFPFAASQYLCTHCLANPRISYLMQFAAPLCNDGLLRTAPPAFMARTFQLCRRERLGEQE